MDIYKLKIKITESGYSTLNVQLIYDDKVISEDSIDINFEDHGEDGSWINLKKQTK